MPDPERLHLAAQDGDLDAVSRLVADGEDINAFDDLGKTPLHYAADREHVEVARYLIEHGANVNAHHEPTLGNTPLGDVAATCSYVVALDFSYSIRLYASGAYAFAYPNAPASANTSPCQPLTSMES